MEEMFQRWKASLRYKAGVYEHESRKRGEDVVYPSLDDICNEMNAFMAGWRSAVNPIQFPTVRLEAPDAKG